MEDILFYSTEFVLIVLIDSFKRIILFKVLKLSEIVLIEIF